MRSVQKGSGASVGARAARFLRGGLFVWLAVAAAFALVAIAIPRAYESTAILEIAPVRADPNIPPDAERIERQIRTVTEDPKRLDELARLEEPDPSKEALASAQESIRVRTRSSRTFEVSYRARSAELAERGCTTLAAAVVAQFPAQTSTDKEEDPRTLLERRTKELTDFVVAHPDVTLGAASSSRSAGASHAAPTSDPAVSILRQEKARIEAELATAEQNEKAPIAHDNPYEDVQPAPDLTVLKQRLVEIRAAIIAHQSAVAASPTAPAASGKSGSAAEGEWRKLVHAVADAQRMAFTAPPDSGARLVASIVEAASLPSVPVESWRGPVAFLGIVLGLVAGVLSVLFRTLTDHREGTESERPRPTSDRVAAPIAIAGSGEIPTSEPPAVKLDSTSRGLMPEGRRVSSPRPPAPGEPAPVTEAQQTAHRAVVDVAIPRPPAVPSFGPGRTQIGMIDPAIFAAQRNSAPPGVQRLESRPIVNVTSERQSAPPPAPQTPNPNVTTSPSPRPPPVSRTWAKTISSHPPQARASATRHTSSPLPPRPDPSRQSSNPPRPDPSKPSSKPPRPDPSRHPSSNPPASRPSTQATPVAPRPSMPERQSPLPPRPSGTPGRPRMDSVSGSSTPQRASEAPRVPTPIGMPLAARQQEDDRAPSTHRMGSPGDLVGREQGATGEKGDSLAVYRTDTSYSFVDPDAREVSRRRSERAQSGSTSDRPAVTQVGLAEPSQQGLATQGQSRSSISSRPPPAPYEDDLVAPRSAPPSWRLGPGITEEAVQDELHALCDQVLSLAQQRCFVVGVTTEANLDAAKSRTAARLAALLAADGRTRVLLMEANFDYPLVQRLMAIEMPHSSGFSQQMRARIKSGERRPWVVVRCSATLHVLGEGVVRSPGILFSQEFSAAVAELRRCYDVIIADGPISGVGADAKPLDAVCDGVVFVIPPGAVLGDGLDRASKWFKRKELMAAVPAEMPPRP